MRQNPVGVSDSRDNARDELVLELKDCFGIESAFVILGPEMSAGNRVHELHCETQFCSGLPQASFHDKACTEFLAGVTNIDCLIGVPRNRAASDHLEIRKAR